MRRAKARKELSWVVVPSRVMGDVLVSKSRGPEGSSLHEQDLRELLPWGGGAVGWK